MVNKIFRTIGNRNGADEVQEGGIIIKLEFWMRI